MIAKSKKIIKNYTALVVVQSSLYGGSSGTSDTQVYDAYEGQYYPDYTLTPLVLKPQVSIIDRDGVINSDNINASLDNIVWTIESTDSSKNGTITSGKDGYEVTSTGQSRGALKISQNNLSAGERVTYKFTATYKDSRTSQIINVCQSYLLQCMLAAEATPVLTIDVDGNNIYNPIHHESDITINAQLYMGDSGPVSESEVKYVWCLSYADEVPDLTSVVGSDFRDGYVAEVSEDTKSLTIHRDYMGDVLSVRCVAKFETGTDPDSIELSNSLPTKSATLRRDLGNYTIDIVNCSSTIGYDALDASMMVKASDGSGDIGKDTLERVFNITWGLTSDGETLKNELAYGVSASIPTSNMTSGSMTIGVDVTDKGSYSYMTDESGDYFIDEDGYILLSN